jgi:5'-phosphate synthase pdxT subunit
MQKPRIAVLGLQGDFQKHIDRLNELGADAFNARLSEEISSADGIVIPGGESTTIGKLLVRFQLLDSLRKAGIEGKPIFGTCAGLIVLAAHVTSDTSEKGGQTTLGLLDATVSRNAFGRQIESCECVVDAPEIAGSADAPLSAVFIRAPILEKVGKNVKVLASYSGRIVFVRQDNLLGASFHPELTPDPRVHQYFLNMVQNYLAGKAASQTD